MQLTHQRAFNSIETFTVAINVFIIEQNEKFRKFSRLSANIYFVLVMKGQRSVRNFFSRLDFFVL